MPQNTSSKYCYELSEHKGTKVILIRFDYDPTLVEEVRQLVGRKWSQTLRCWYVSDNSYYRQKFGLKSQKDSERVLQKIAPVNRQALADYMDELQLRGYSPNTQKTYRYEFMQLLYLLKEHDVCQLDTNTLKSYFLYCSEKLKLSENQIHSRFNAIKFYFEKVLHREQLFIRIPRPKKQLLLPKHIHAKDIKKLFEVTINLKHNTMLKLCYGMGLRVSEIVNLKITDIDSANMQVYIERGKGKKDRYANLPESILEQLREYYKKYRPKKYLFEGQFGGQYSIRSAQKVFKNALLKSGINKDVGIHSLRHSYATHLLENGTDISYIQKLLGHKNIKTTLIYADVGKQNLRNIKSPLDDI